MSTAAIKMQKFAEKYGASAANAAKGTAIFPQTILSAAALESGYGTSGLTKAANNFFGIKKGSWTGEVVYFDTREQRPDGTWFTVKAPFRKYNTPEDSFKNYVETITKSRYINAGVTKAKTPEEQFEAIKRGGYATDINYASKLTTLYGNIKSMVFDTIKKNKTTVTISTIIGVALVSYAVWYYYKRNKN